MNKDVSCYVYNITHRYDYATLRQSSTALSLPHKLQKYVFPYNSFQYYYILSVIKKNIHISFGINCWGTELSVYLSSLTSLQIS